MKIEKEEDSLAIKEAKKNGKNLRKNRIWIRNEGFTDNGHSRGESIEKIASSKDVLHLS